MGNCVFNTDRTNAQSNQQQKWQFKTHTHKPKMLLDTWVGVLPDLNLIHIFNLEAIFGEKHVKRIKFIFRDFFFFFISNKNLFKIIFLQISLSLCKTSINKFNNIFQKKNPWKDALVDIHLVVVCFGFSVGFLRFLLISLVWWFIRIGSICSHRLIPMWFTSIWVVWPIVIRFHPKCCLVLWKLIPTRMRK